MDRVRDEFGVNLDLNTARTILRYLNALKSRDEADKATIKRKRY